MRFGFRSPSLKKRIAARTSLRRYVRHSLGFKAPRGFGILTNPKKSMYNKIYYRTTVGLEDLFKIPRVRKNRNYAKNDIFNEIVYGATGDSLSPDYLTFIISGILLGVFLTNASLRIVTIFLGYFVFAHKKKRWPFLLPPHEQQLVLGCKSLHSGQVDTALDHFLIAAPHDTCAALFAAALLGKKDGREAEAIAWLENAIDRKEIYPTRMMQKYRLSWALNIKLTASIQVDLPMNQTGATILLAKILQEHAHYDKALRYLLVLVHETNDPLAIIALCELCVQMKRWNEIVNYANKVLVQDDITLQIIIFYGRALQELGSDKEAINILTQALKTKHSRNTQLLQSARYWRAISYGKTGQISLSEDELRELDKESNLEMGKDTKKESMPASTEKQNTPAWVRQVITAGNGVVPIFTAKILGELPISSRTEAKKVYRALLERYHIVGFSEVARCVDMLSHDIEIAVWGVRDDVRYMRETIRDIKNQLKEAQLKLRKATGMEKKYVLTQIDELKKDLSKYEDEMADAVNIRDSFLRDKRDYIANHINRLAHGDDWAFTPGPVKYFIYRDAEGKITARSITNMQSDIESVTGHCSTRNAERTFKRCRILEHAADQNDLFERLKKYDSAGAGVPVI